MSNVCTRTVPRNLCIGCGVCAGICPTGNLAMNWTREGFLQPNDRGKCLPKCHRCVAVCPFLDQSEDETTLGKLCFEHIPGIQHTPETGFYLENFEGYACGPQREHSASGGLTTWLLTKLLNSQSADGVICVVPGHQGNLFGYKVCRTSEEILGAARSAYHPIEISEALHFVRQVPGRYAITCLPCVSKAIRLACLQDKILGNRITFLFGLVCGQNKSKLFSEYCAAASGGNPDHLTTIKYRMKYPNDKSKMGVECTFLEKGSLGIRRLTGWGDGFGRVWNNYAFTLFPCLLCDDVFAETADAALMDAWLPEYLGEVLGTSIALIRHPLLKALLELGVTTGEISISPISVQRVRQSQDYQVANKRRLIVARMAQLKGNVHVPRKRHQLFVKPSWLESAQERGRLAVQAASPRLWLSRKSVEEFVGAIVELERPTIVPRVVQRSVKCASRLYGYLIRRLKDRS